MAELTKQDVKEAVSEALEGSFPRLFEKSFTPFAGAIQSDFNRMDDNFKEVRSDIAVLKSGLAEIKSDVTWMRTNSGEIFTKLDGFITLYKKQEEEMAILSKQSARFEERISALERKLNV